MDDDASNSVYRDPLAHWFVTEAYRIADTGELVAAAGERLVAAGIPLWRLAYFQFTLHPEFDGKAYFWRRGRGVEVEAAAPGLRQRTEYLDNPIARVIDQRRAYRARLTEVEPQEPVLRQLRSEGATDYVALPLLFTTGHIDALSVVSDGPAGFAGADLQRMFLLQFAFTRIVETHSLRDTAVNLLDAYVGRAAGQRILAGEVKRGDGQTIEAVIWYSDLRGFTRASDTLPRNAVIDLLNDYFGATGEAVTSAGGEILKFMGDAMLAMFPVATPAGRAETAARALWAAAAATETIAALNVGRVAAGELDVRFGLALHIGEVMFGNIGASKRLDFTVIGPAVNYASRLEKLCADLGRPLVLSAAMAGLLPSHAVDAIGRFALRGIDVPQEVYGLRGISA